MGQLSKVWPIEVGHCVLAFEQQLVEHLNRIQRTEGASAGTVMFDRLMTYKSVNAGRLATVCRCRSMSDVFGSDNGLGDSGAMAEAGARAIEITPDMIKVWVGRLRELLDAQPYQPVWLLQSSRQWR